MRATNSPSPFGSNPNSYAKGLRLFSASRRRTVSCDRLLCSVSLTIAPASSSSVQRARPLGGLAQAVATNKASSLPVSLRSAPGRGSSLSARSRLPSTKRLGPVHGRAAHADAPCNLFVAGPGIGGQQNLRSLEPARRMLAAAEQRPQCGALDLAEVDPIAYIHGVPPSSRRASTTESDGRRESFDKNLHAQAGAVSGLYPPLYAVAPQTSGRNRHPGIFSRQPAFGSPDGADAGTSRPHHKATKDASQHRGPR